MALRFRIKGTGQVLIPRMTDNGTIVLDTDTTSNYIDDYFHENRKVPELEMSVDEVVWWQMVNPDEDKPSMEIIRPDDYNKE